MLSQPNNTANIDPQLTMMEMISGYWVSQCIYVATKLKIADLLQDGSMTCEALARATNTDSDALYRILRALASKGIFKEIQPKCFSMTNLGTFLCNDMMGSLRNYILMLGEEHYQTWGSLLDSVNTGNSAFEQIYEMDVYSYYLEDPNASNIFELAMTELSVKEDEAILNAYDFSEIKSLVDVGGGLGSLLSAIVDNYPQITGTLLEQPYIIKKTKLSRLIRLVEGNFLSEVPEGADCYLLKHIIHNWDDDRALSILRNCHQGMDKNGKLLVIEQVIPPGNDPCAGKFLDINMLVMSPGGRERTELEYQLLFKSAGFKINKIISTSADINIIEGIKINR